jgi:hypothetical protein
MTTKQKPGTEEMKMNNLAWNAAKNLKKAIEVTGRRPTLNHYVILLWLAAQEEGVSLEEIVQKLSATVAFEVGVTKLDRDAHIRDLGF